MKLLTVGLVLVTAAVAGCSSTTAGTDGAEQDDVAASATASAGASTPGSLPGTNQDLGKYVPSAPPVTAPSQSCTTPIADNAWTSPPLGPNGNTSQTYSYFIEVTAGSNCTNFVWISTTVNPSSGGGNVLLDSGTQAFPMNNTQLAPTKDMAQSVYYFSGGVGTTVFQIQDSTGTLGGTYTVNIVAQ
jgi:hypothetical protein